MVRLRIPRPASWPVAAMLVAAALGGCDLDPGRVDDIVHAVDVCGEDAVGIGTDGPVTPIDDLDA